MSGSQKALKIISIVLIVYAALMLLLGALMAAGSQVPGMSGTTIDMGDGTAMDASMAAVALGVGTVIGGVVYLVIALLGLRGAKNPAKIGAFFVLCVIGLVLGVIGVGMSIVQGSLQWQSLVGLALIAVCTFLAAKIKKQA